MATETIRLASPFVGSGGRVIVSPFQFALDADTNLRVISANAVAGVSIVLQGRRLDDKGTLQPIAETHTPNNDRSVKIQDYTLGLGALLNLTVFASAGAPLIGQTYVMLQIIRGFSGAKIVLGTLLAGYITATQALGFPGSPILSSLEGEPVVRNIVGTSPAPGSFNVETCPTGARWELVTFHSKLTTSVAVANRKVFLEIIAGAQPSGIYQLSSVQTANSIADYTFAQNLPIAADAASGAYQFPIPQRQFLRAGDLIEVGAVVLDLADQFAAARYQVREWLEVQ